MEIHRSVWNDSMGDDVYPWMPMSCYYFTIFESHAIDSQDEV